MSSGCEQEQSELRDKNVILAAKIEAFNEDCKNTEKFVALVRKYTEITELSAAVINEFVEKIVVHEGVWSEGKRYGSRSQQIEVYLRYIGVFDVPDLRTPEEIEMERIAEEKKDRRRAQNRERMRRYSAKKKAEREATKIS
jgi:hypothetical protein